MSSLERPSVSDGGSSKKWQRTRSGCLTCRRKKRKCDESRPTCMRCSRVGATCEWGPLVSFKLVNQIPPSQPPPQHDCRRRDTSQGSPTEVLDLTREGNSDYRRRRPALLAGNARLLQGSPERGRSLGNDLFESVLAGCDIHAYQFESDQHSASLTSNTSPSAQYPDPNTPLSQQAESAAAHLISLSQTTPAPHIADRTNEDILPTDLTSVEGLDPELLDFDLQDGLFLPGSAYLNLHSTLRNHLIQEGRSQGPTRCPTPKSAEDSTLQEPPGFLRHELGTNGNTSGFDEELSAALTEEQEALLWVNWLEEVAPWLDKFDHHKHFQHTLSLMAESHAYVKYAIMAVSARQLERKSAEGKLEHETTIPSSLGLYQQAIHLLLPQLATRSTPVIASCVVLCVLEMLSCSPKAWQRHLDGCASLLQAVGIHGFSGGLEQALFWCFARMDVCGGLISSTKTLIPISSWTPTTDLAEVVHLSMTAVSFDMHANLAIYLAAHAVDLLADPAINSSESVFTSSRTNKGSFIRKWTELWGYVDNWYTSRPKEMHPVFIKSSSGPFPTILFSNPAAISGNQMYHTTALLMLQHKPAQAALLPRSRSILWHARRIVGISKSNAHHGCWTNSLQPLWIAGRIFSSPDEHRAILDLLARIEKESGWATKWRADDLKQWWGDLDDET